MTASIFCIQNRPLARCYSQLYHLAGQYFDADRDDPLPDRQILVRPVVPFFSVLREIQPHLLVFRTHPKTDHLVDDKENDQSAHNR